MKMRPMNLVWCVLALVCALLVVTVVRNGPRETLGHLVMLLSEDTAYAPGYSKRAFDIISVGDSEASVLAALGPPIKASPATPYSIWLYADETHPGFTEHGDYPDLRYSYTSLRFDEKAHFESASGQLSQGSRASGCGLSVSGSFGDGVNTLSLSNAVINVLKQQKSSPQDIEARFGKPQATFESRVAKWLQYSHSPGSTHYRQRRVGIDTNGVVCRIDRELYWD